MNYIQESLDYSLIWPATNVDENGKLVNPPYRVFLLTPIDLVLGLAGQKRGFKYFIDEGYLCKDAAEKYIKEHNKHNLLDSLGIINTFGQESFYGKRKAVIHVKSFSGCDTQAYPITYDKIPLREDKKDDIMRSLTTLGIIHQCKIINFANTISIDPKKVEKWLGKVKIRDLKIFYLCPHILTGLLHLASDPYIGYALDYDGTLEEEKLVKAIGPQLRWINQSKSFKLRDLNKEMSREIFDDTKLYDLINNRLFSLWYEDTLI